MKLNDIYECSDQFLLGEDLLEGSITLSCSSNIATEGDDVGLAQVDGSIGLDITDWNLDWGVILGSDHSVGVVAFPGQEDVGQLVLVVNAASHSGLDVSLSSGLHG